MDTNPEGRFSVQFMGHMSVGHIIYLIKVTSPEGDTWNIQKRYREIRDLNEQLRKRHREGLPTIPAKRLFGNLDPTFIARRMGELQTFFDGILKLEPVPRTPAFVHFLGGPQRHAARNQEQQHQQILDNLNKMLLNLSLPPAPLEEADISQRLRRYGQAMKLHVLCQPVDPIYLRAPLFDNHLATLATTNGERFEALKAAPPPGSGDAALLEGLHANLRAILVPTEPLADPHKLVIPFPTISQ
eukprot:NODE_1775_length_1065_cov_129.229703.p2 GENE.NODE_1775_length_1065_cov_129.229703~~NODE_1775_length_1065_cov_129.229703.p2  ORF type:complete len:243 (+),score=74.09 NODE_1775_length_1065_cov_129.229703:124-852(+)